MRERRDPTADPCPKASAPRSRWLPVALIGLALTTLPISACLDPLVVEEELPQPELTVAMKSIVFVHGSNHVNVFAWLSQNASMSSPAS